MTEFINFILSFGQVNITLWLLNGFVWSFAWNVYMKAQMKYEENSAVLVTDLIHSLTIGALGGYMWAPWCILWIIGDKLSKAKFLKKKLF